MIIEDKLPLTHSLLDGQTGILRIAEVKNYRKLDGQYGVYTMLDVNLITEKGTEFKMSWNEKRREPFVSAFGTETDNWVGARFRYTAIVRGSGKTRTEDLDIDEVLKPSADIVIKPKQVQL